jgi:[protein-PII] uridylyltransferase
MESLYRDPETYAAPMALDRSPLLADEVLSGAAWCEAHSALIDAWLADLLERACQSAAGGLALVAVGGYGRSELCPASDIDVMLVHDGRGDVASAADRIWYPIWDTGLHLGHSVCTVREALRLAADDLDTATALLSARHVAGDAALTAGLAGGALTQWQHRSRHWLVELASRVDLRHERAGEVAFCLEPDLKEGRGGLRDVHALRWAEAARPALLPQDSESLSRAYAVILGARVELHRTTGRPGNILALQEQPAVAAALGDTEADALMARVAEAARTIAWTSDDVWRRVQTVLRNPRGRLAGRRREVSAGVFVRDGEVEVECGDGPIEDPVLVLRAAAAAAGQHAVIERHSLERLAAHAPPLPDPWPAEARALFVELLLAGRSAVRVIEALDQRGVWVRVLPEWEPVRARPQHNAYHRFTVDRHLLETAANAARLAEGAERPDLLVVAALLHDVGKGYGGDHTNAGVVLARTITSRMGYPPGDIETMAALVEQHLLLSEIATRRDLDDPATIQKVAGLVGSVGRLRLLAALTEADSVATGTSAWGPWKAGLVHQLVDRVAQLLEGGGQPPDTSPGRFPTAAQLARLAAGGQHIDCGGNVVTVITADRPGIFSRVAGVLTLHGLDVLAAAAYSDDGRALSEFLVADPFRDETPWGRVAADLERAVEGRLALHARVAERARLYSRPARIASRRRFAAAVRFDNHASADATVIDVHASDATGVLYRITRALAELDLDIRRARVQTLGAQVVDAFYVRDAQGKITDDQRLAEVERAILHCLGD